MKYLILLAILTGCITTQQKKSNTTIDRSRF